MEAMVIELALTFAISLIGAICKDYYNTLVKEDNKVQLPRILLSAVTGTIVIFSLNAKEKFGDRLYVLICYGGGILGLELFSKIKSLDVDKIGKVIDMLRGGKSDKDNKDK